MRRQYNKLVSQIKTDTKAWDIFILEEAWRTEKAYIAKLADDTKWVWLAVQSMLKQLALQLAKKSAFFSTAKKL